MASARDAVGGDRHPTGHDRGQGDERDRGQQRTQRPRRQDLLLQHRAFDADRGCSWAEHLDAERVGLGRAAPEALARLDLDFR